jgi:DNA-binding transcriptional LysR family regulator
MRPYTLKQLNTFIEVAKEKSVSKAADKLHVTQPAISMQIKQLEDVFGLALIEPSGRNIQLTPAGEDFYINAMQAVSQLKDLESVILGHIDLGRGSVTLGIVSTTKYFVPMLLVEFRKSFPGIQFTLKIDNRENIIAMLTRNEVDMVIMGRMPDNLELESIPFVTNPMAIVATPRHPLSRKKNIDLTSLANETFIIREKGSGTRQAMERIFQGKGVTLNSNMEMPSNETIKQAVMAGMSLGFLSLRTVRHEIAGGHIAVLDIAGLPLIGHWYLTHQANKKLSPAAKGFKEFILSQGKALIEVWA